MTLKTRLSSCGHAFELFDVDDESSRTVMTVDIEDRDDTASISRAANLATMITELDGYISSIATFVEAYDDGNATPDVSLIRHVLQRCRLLTEPL